MTTPPPGTQETASACYDQSRSNKWNMWSNTASRRQSRIKRNLVPARHRVIVVSRREARINAHVGRVVISQRERCGHSRRIGIRVHNGVVASSPGGKHQSVRQPAEFDLVGPGRQAVETITASS